MIELVRVEAPHFVAGLVLRDGRCVNAAPILGWAIGRPGWAILGYCRRKRWRAELVTRHAQPRLA